MLMGGIVCLANAKLQLQLAWLGAYVIINIAHWFAAALPQEMHWDLSCYEVQEHGIEGGGGPESATFTEALWKAIALTKTTQWVAANWPTSTGTETWKQWIRDADVKAEETEWREATGFNDDNFLWKAANRFKIEVWKIPDWNPRQVWEDLDKSGAVVVGQAV